MLELNDVLLSGAKSTLSLMACDGELTCLTRPGAPLGSTAVRWLHAMMGLEPTTGGFISIDGEPLTASSARSMRQLMAFVPAELGDVGQVVVFSAPTADDVFRLKANRNGKPEQMEQEMALTGATGQKAQLLAVASLPSPQGRRGMHGCHCQQRQCCGEQSRQCGRNRIRKWEQTIYLCGERCCWQCYWLWCWPC